MQNIPVPHFLHLYARHQPTNKNHLWQRKTKDNRNLRYNGVRNLLNVGYKTEEWAWNSPSEQVRKNKAKQVIREQAEAKGLVESENNTNFVKNQNINETRRKAAQSAGHYASLLQRLFDTRTEGKKQENYATSRGTSEESQRIRERIPQEENERRNSEIKYWAIQNNCWIPAPISALKEIFGEMKGGTESRVWRDDNRNVAVKALFPRHYQGDMSRLFDRVLIHNMAFPDTAMKLVAIGTDSSNAEMMKGDTSLVVEQPWVEYSGETATYEEIYDYMDGHNFTRKGEEANAEYRKDGYVVSDIRPENVIKKNNGDLAVVDCWAKFEEENSLQNSNQLATSSQQTTNQQTPQDKATVKEFIDHLRSKGITVHEEDLSNFNAQSAQIAQEMNSIREQAVKDGNIVPKEDGSFDYALAPNGKKSNLNERQWLQVRTWKSQLKIIINVNNPIMKKISFIVMLAAVALLFAQCKSGESKSEPEKADAQVEKQENVEAQNSF